MNNVKIDPIYRGNWYLDYIQNEPYMIINADGDVSVPIIEEANPIDKKVEGEGNSYTVTYIGPEDPAIIIKILFTSDTAGSIEIGDAGSKLDKFNIIKK
ncbi:hypothetical protein BHAMNSH16_08070 [Brachyspira hampsonii]|uniref:Uncharacterized protein n=1 Tax=Brachyspira hampsonii TaxID=1287055 RepID=A0AAC9XKF0_9SPIR|nr:hypothetical protein [Brachyspira hampsonii]ASJ21600.1 hypothetical protein BHAMNSH16_08070 [Brachyspira hampsonii]MBW5380763.1 hypothetical protein [Brachyspira hampsonii]MBW5411255.1 hypothetical protein [Brachyspira hampsonii]OEJ16444.1 hypothetical protein A9496_13435 [Brachyspira hampsonii]